MRASDGDAEPFRRVRVNGLELACSEAGPTDGAGADAPPLVLVHGFTGHRDDWAGVLPALARRRRTIVFDLRGHGDSDSPTDSSAYSFEWLVKDLFGLLDALDVTRCDLLGHSFGGMIALRAALAGRRRLRSLILMNTAPELPERLSRAGWEKATAIAEARGMTGLQQAAERAGRARPDATLAGWFERYWQHHRRRLAAMTPASYRGLGSVLFESESLVARLGELTLPSLVVVGEADVEFGPGAELLERHLPDVRRVTIAGAGHHPHQENPEAWLAAIESHLARAAAPPTPSPAQAGR